MPLTPSRRAAPDIHCNVKYRTAGALDELGFKVRCRLPVETPQCAAPGIVRQTPLREVSDQTCSIEWAPTETPSEKSASIMDEPRNQSEQPKRQRFQLHFGRSQLT